MLSLCYFRFVIKRKFSFIRRLPGGRVGEKDLVQGEEWNKTTIILRRKVVKLGPGRVRGI